MIEIGIIFMTVYLTWTLIDSYVFKKQLDELNERLTRLEHEVGSVLPTIEDSEISSQQAREGRQLYLPSMENPL